MSSSAMRSGRGARLPGMGAPATAPAPPAAVPEPPTATSATARPERRSAGRAAGSNTAGRRRAADDRKPPRDSSLAAGPSYIPHAGETKIQVNPRIYRGIWNHYEQLVDELPRDRRRGALTALVNAVLAQHAPRNVAEARAAISWLRQAEARDTGS